VKKELLTIKIRNHVRQSEYSDIVNTCQLLLNEYDNKLDSLERIKYKDTKSLYETLIDLKPLLVHKKGSYEIQSYRNPYLNFIMLPVAKGNKTAEFLFDTGADMSVITSSCAKEMGLPVYETNTDVETSVGIIKANIAVADSLYLGDILFENVIFLVMPLFSIPELNFKMNGIIGVKEMRKLEEIHIQKNGSIFIPETPLTTALPNMYLTDLEGLSLVIQVQSNNDTLLMEFDTGANVSNLTKRYYDTYSEKIKENMMLKDKAVHGAGGGTQ
jgi:predicted aspartyl protease